MRLLVEGKADYSEEDSGCAAIAEVADEGSVFVRIQEWNDDPEKNHFARSLKGKRVRVTIEVDD